LECIAYGDDVFGYEQYGIHDYIQNYAKHDKHPNYSKTTGYKPTNNSWYNGDMEKWTGGPNGGEVWLYSYYNGGHWPMDLNRHIIWNFCKRFSLNMPMARITEPAGETVYLYMAPLGEDVFPDITVKATAQAVKGEVAKVEFYDGSKLIDSLKVSPYETTVTAPASGKHNLRVVVTDTNGKTAESTCLVNYVSPKKTTYSLHTNFKCEGAVPMGWYVTNGSTKRTGSGTTYTNGPRILKFTNSSKSFEYGLLVQNGTSKEKTAYAKFGDSSARSYLTMHPGYYTIKYKLCNWNQSNFKPVTIAIEDLDGKEVASQTYTPTVNIGGNVANKFTGVAQQTFEFAVPEQGDYVIVIYTDAARNADFVLGQLMISAKEYTTTGIFDVERLNGNGQMANDKRGGVYDFSGRKILDFNSSTEHLKPGLYIIDGRKTVIQ
jgi:hypothetical protein